VQSARPGDNVAPHGSSPARYRRHFVIGFSLSNGNCASPAVAVPDNPRPVAAWKFGAGPAMLNGDRGSM